MQLFNITLFGEMLTFIILIFVTMKYIWPPIIKAINTRQQKIADGLAAAEKGQHDLVLARDNAVKILQKAHLEASDIIDNAHNHVAKIIEQGKSQAKQEAAKIKAMALAEIETQTIAANAELKEQTVLAAAKLAEKILKQKIDAKLDQQLIERMLTEDLSA